MAKTFFTNETLFKIIGCLLCFIGSYYIKQQHEIIVAMDTRLYNNENKTTKVCADLENHILYTQKR
jgi:hypothetical protein